MSQSDKKDKQKNELLEPSGISSNSVFNICGPKKNPEIPEKTRPNFADFPKPSETLSRVRIFLPQIIKADEILQQQIQRGENVDIESVKDGEKYVEMNVGLFEEEKNQDGGGGAAGENWSVDSDPDSPPSPAERDNAFTSDSDSSSSCSSCSSTEEKKVG
jgi:hypothetical protein